MVTIRPADDNDLDRIADLVQQAFNFPAQGVERLKRDPQLENVRVAEHDGRIVGTMRNNPFAHFFGGQPIRSAGISAVAVAPDARGQGVGATLMREALRELRGAFPVSSLYPATVPIYRGTGYGFGGVRTIWKASLRDLPQRAGTIAVEPFADENLEHVNTAYEKAAARANGLLRRDEGWWKNRVFSGWTDKPTYRYLVREDGDVTGWVIYQIADPKHGWRATVSCRDLFWNTAAAGRALLSMASLHRSTCEKMDWLGPPTEPLADLVGEDPFEVEHVFRWMIRLLDVPAALEARGYPPGIDAAVTIGVRDALFPENEGPWRLEVSGGEAKVFPADDADATADVQTWASIWSRHHLARDAARLGGLSATDEAIDALEMIFAGPAPWIADFF